MTWTRTATTRARRHPTWIFAAGLLAVAACSGSRADGSASTDAETTAAPSTAAPTTERATTTTAKATTTTARATTTTAPRPPAEPARMPLTGKPLAYGQRAPDRPALVVKIDNVSAKPQSGLNQADIVFEEVVEGRATRFAAVFHSEGSNPVGPIRSGRTQDVDLLTGLNRPLFAWSGGNPGVTAAIENSQLIPLTHGSAAGYFRTERVAPHDLYNNTDTLWAQAPREAGRPRPLFRYVLPRERVSGESVSSLDVQVGHNHVRWEWSQGCKCYLRFENGSAHEATDGQVNADNVVVLETGYRPSYVDARSPEAITVGDGKAFVMSDGRLRIGRWERKVNTDPVRIFVGPRKQLMEIAPGRTWVELADVLDAAVSFERAG